MSFISVLYFTGFGVCYLTLGMLYKLKGDPSTTGSKFMYSLFSWFGVFQVLKEFDIECDKQDNDHTY